MTKKIKGYKAFNSDLSCRGFQYEVGKTYRCEGPIEVCYSGFHFCQRLRDCFNYYEFNLCETRIAEVIATGQVVTNIDKSVTNEITIVREVSQKEILAIVNMGIDNTGIDNTGNNNFGNSNVGDRNFGKSNTGCQNTGWGNSNTGNVGYRNSGYQNIGNGNTGRWNYGSSNVGDNNIGNGNTGHYNNGDCNTGNYNACNFSSGFFNTKDPKIYIFNKPTEYTSKEFKAKYSEAMLVLNSLMENITIWVPKDRMTKYEKARHRSYQTTGGYLKLTNPKEYAQFKWENLDKNEKELVMSLPNFNKKIFEQITGIRIGDKNEQFKTNT